MKRHAVRDQGSTELTRSCSPPAALPAALEAEGAPLGPAMRVTLGRFVLAALVTSVVNLALHAAAHGLFLKGVYQAYPAGSEEFVRQLERPGDQLVGWAMAVTSLTMGLFITIVMRWSRATTVAAGLGRGAVLGSTFWLSVNSGLYASSHHFSLPAAALDTISSSLCMAISALCAVLLLHRLGPAARREPQPARA